MTKMRFEELEKRCSKLKKARILRMVLSISLLFLVSFGVYYWMLPTEEKPVAAVEKTPSKYEVVSLPSLSDCNESNATRIEMNIMAEVSSPETLFLAPHIYKNEVKLPVTETEEATRSLNEEHQLLKRYHEIQNFENAYALAHLYFERKAYAEAIMWAKETSKYNSNSEKPWILYAKAKFYLGDRTEAIRSLELFLSYINSSEVQELLNFYKGQE